MRPGRGTFILEKIRGKRNDIYASQSIKEFTESLSQAILQQYGVDDSMTAHLVPLPGEIEQVQAWALFVEQPEGYYRVRLRSKTKPINEIAKRHHGGGHPLASGLTTISPPPKST